MLKSLNWLPCSIALIDCMLDCESCCHLLVDTMVHVLCLSPRPVEVGTIQDMKPGHTRFLVDPLPCVKCSNNT